MVNNIIQLWDESASVRSIEVDGEIWFVGKDVCQHFGDTNYRRTLARVPDNQKRKIPFQTCGGAQNMTTINESGVYYVLLTMQPQKAVSLADEALQVRIEKVERFQHWVTHDVLPNVRKYGAYFKGMEKLSDTQIKIKLLSERLAQMDAHI